MGFLEYGSVRGLSLGHDYQRDIDRLYDRERYSMEVRKERENKARYYGELTQQKQATTPNNTRLLEGYYDELTGELADFVINNPNFETDINLQRHFQDIAGRFQDNNIIREDMQVARSLEDLKNEMLSGEMDEEDYITEMDRYMEYANNGGDPYVFENFKKVYFDEVVGQLAVAASAGMQTTTVVTDERVMEVSEVDPANLDYIARMSLTRPDYDRVIEKAWKEARKTGMDDSKLDFLRKVISAQVEYGNKFRAWNPKVAIEARARAEAQTNFNMAFPLVGNYILDPLFGEGEVNADSRHLAFTPWRTKNNTFNPGIYNPKDGGKFQTLFKNTLKKDEDDPNYIPLDINQTIAATGAGRLFLDKYGRAFAEVNVAIPIIADTTNLEPELIKYGWSYKKYSDLGILSEALMGIEDITQTSNVYQGTIVVPATFHESQMHDYTIGWTGSKIEAMKMQAAYGPLSEKAEHLQLVSILKAKFPDSGTWTRAVSKKGEILLTSSDGKWVHNVSTNETVSR